MPMTDLLFRHSSLKGVGDMELVDNSMRDASPKALVLRKRMLIATMVIVCCGKRKIGSVDNVSTPRQVKLSRRSYDRQ